MTITAGWRETDVDYAPQKTYVIQIDPGHFDLQ